jgi:hypothetical protein
MSLSSAIETPQLESASPRLRVCYLIESGTDVRTVEGLAERFELTLVARRMLDGVEISQPPNASSISFSGLLRASASQFSRRIIFASTVVSSITYSSRATD